MMRNMIMRRTAAICLAAASFAASSGGFAQTYYSHGAPPPAPAQAYPYPPYPNPPYADGTYEGRSAAEQDRARYDWSGTRGRMGLGASPYHPEGPGNVSTPHF